MWSPTKLEGTQALHHSYVGIGMRTLEGPAASAHIVSSQFGVPRGRDVSDAEWRVTRKRRVQQRLPPNKLFQPEGPGGLS